LRRPKDVSIREVNMTSLDYTPSASTLPIIEMADGTDVDEELQDVVNDFVYRVFFTPTSSIQLILHHQADKTNTRSLVASDVDKALIVLREVYAGVASRLTADSIEAEMIGGSRMSVRIELAVNDTGGSPLVISNTFSTTAGM